MDEDIYFILGEVYVKYRKQLAITEGAIKVNEELKRQNQELETLNNQLREEIDTLSREEREQGGNE